MKPTTSIMMVDSESTRSAQLGVEAADDDPAQQLDLEDRLADIGEQVDPRAQRR